jgi:hypothetical protein
VDKNEYNGPIYISKNWRGRSPNRKTLLKRANTEVTEGKLPLNVQGPLRMHRKCRNLL